MRSLCVQSTGRFLYSFFCSRNARFFSNGIRQPLYSQQAGPPLGKNLTGNRLRVTVWTAGVIKIWCGNGVGVTGRYPGGVELVAESRDPALEIKRVLWPRASHRVRRSLMAEGLWKGFRWGSRFGEGPPPPAVTPVPFRGGLECELPGLTLVVFAAFPSSVPDER